MDTKNMIKRINELANKAKIEELSLEEKAEQKKLREAYIGLFRSNLKNTLDNIEYVDDEK